MKPYLCLLFLLILVQAAFGAAFVSPNRGMEASNFVWLTKSGSDLTGVRGREDRPFGTLTGALAVAQSGDTVQIGLGRFTNILNYSTSALNTALWVITNKTNFTIQGSGPGTVLYGAGPGAFFRTSNTCYNVVFRDFTIEGNKPGGAAQTNGVYAGIEVGGISIHTQIRNVRFLNLGDHGVAYPVFETGNFDSDTVVEGCYFENGGNTNGVPSLGLDGGAIIVFGQRFKAIGNTITNWARGIEVHQFSGTINNALIANNTISGIRGDAAILVIPDPPALALDTAIVNNTIHFDFSHYAYDAFNTAGVQIGRGERSLVAGNTIRGGNWGVYLTQPCKFARVANNVISGQRYTGVFFEENNNVQDNIVEGNQVSFTGAHGIRVNGARNLIRWNTVSECSTNGAGGYGINLNPFNLTTHWDNQIIGNFLYDRQSSPTMTGGINLGAASTNTIVMDNVYGVGISTRLNAHATATYKERIFNTTGLGVLTNLPSVAVHVEGALALAPGAVVNLTADNQVVSATNRSTIRLSSDNGAAGNRTFILTGQGHPVGQTLTLEWTGTNAGELVDDSAQNGAGNHRLSATWTPTQWDTITLIFNGTDWVEVMRSAN